LEESKQNITQYPNEDLWDEEQSDAIYRYESARAAHQEAIQRRQATKSYDKRGTHRVGQVHLVGGLSTVPRYPNSGNILPNDAKDYLGGPSPFILTGWGTSNRSQVSQLGERERLSRRSESAYPDRKEPDQSGYDQYDPRSYASSSSKEHGGLQSSRQSIFHPRVNPREEEEREDWDTRGPRYYAGDPAPGLNANRIDRLRDDLSQQTLAGVTAREKLSERILAVERSRYGLADKTGSLEKMWEELASTRRKLMRLQKQPRLIWDHTRLA
jgi:hypothetical protein